MRRSFEDFKSEVLARHDTAVRKQRKRRRIFAVFIPAVICVCVGVIFVGNDMLKTDEVAEDATEIDVMDYYYEDITNEISTEDKDKGSAAGTDAEMKESTTTANDFAVSEAEDTEEPASHATASANTMDATSEIANSYVSVMSAQVEVIDGETASMRTFFEEEEVKTIEQLITLTGAIDPELEAPICDITVSIRKETVTTVYYYYGDGREIALENATPISAQVAAGILEFLEAKK